MELEGNSLFRFQQSGHSVMAT